MSYYLQSQIIFGFFMILIFDTVCLKTTRLNGSLVHFTCFSLKSQNLVIFYVICGNILAANAENYGVLEVR